MANVKQNIEKSTYFANINTSIKLIEQAINERWLKSFAFFYLLKNEFTNSVVYNYRRRTGELADRFNISEKTVHTYLKILRSKGLIFDNKDNLHLKAIRKIKNDISDNQKTVICISTGDGLNIVTSKLQAKIIERHLRRTTYLKEIENFERGKRNPNTKVMDASVPVSLSIRNTAKLLKINERTAKKTLITLELAGVIQLHRARTFRLCNGLLPLDLLEDYPGYRYYQNGQTFEVYGTQIECLQFPVKRPEINYRKYKAHKKRMKCIVNQ